MTKRNILLIYTGGTIGMIKAHADAPLQPFDFDKLLEEIPELRHLDIHIDATAQLPIIDSSDMDPERWVALGNLIWSNYSAYDGFVLLHGTDTMSYTASALSFLFEHLGKPIILTGSQLPIGVTRTDAKENLITSLEIAAAQRADGRPMVPEVAIYFEYKLLRGNRTHKFSSQHFDAFRSPNYPALAEAGVNVQFFRGQIAPISEEPTTCSGSFNPLIQVVKLTPGTSAKLLLPVLENPHHCALILETYGAGNAPYSDWLSEAIFLNVDRGVPVINVSQCPAGGVDQSKYSNGLWLQELGVISAGDMIFEAALVKAMFLLANAQTASTPQFSRAYWSNLRGERTAWSEL
jgi:L-asparaginase